MILTVGLFFGNLCRTANVILAITSVGCFIVAGPQRVEICRAGHAFAFRFDGFVHQASLMAISGDGPSRRETM